MSTDAAVAQLLDPDFWTELTGLDPDAPSPGRIDVAAATGDQARAGVLRDGYLHLPPLVPPTDVQALLAAVLAVRDAGLPPVFVFALAAPWNLFYRLDAVWQAAFASDWRALPSVWAWVVAPGDRGWRPHRDRDRDPGLHADGGPVSLSAWIPLTAATPVNGCMYIVPMRYHVGDESTIELQDVRALPAAPGAVLAWNHVVTHWGGRAAEHAVAPRVSLSLELQRADATGIYQPTYPKNGIPNLPGRLAVVGRMILRYAHMVQPDPDLDALARALIANSPIHGIERT